MRLFRYPHNFKFSRPGCVATIGNFDGVHVGHQVLLRQLRRHAEVIGLPSMVITFEPHSLEYFNKGSAPARLTSFREKTVLLADQGIDYVLCLRFGPSIAGLTADEFVEQILVNAAGVRCLILGDDFRFGKDRAGDFEMLQKAGRKFGFDVILTETHMLDNERVSSSSIRKMLTDNCFEDAQLLLGRYFSISGRVVHGAKRGRELGFPTANIDLSRRCVPLRGVFAVTVKGADEFARQGVANLGTRPVFDGVKMLLEVHLFDFDKDIYGRHITVEFFSRLRDEKRFASIDELVKQIALDKDSAKDFFLEMNSYSQE